MPWRIGLSELWCLGAVWALCLSRVRGQIYTFEDAAVPASRSLETLYSFYVYAFDDAPDKSQGEPFVKFEHMVASAAGFSPGTNAYQGLQVSIMRYKHFWDLIDPKKFCCTAADDANGVCQRNGVVKDQLLLQKPANESYGDVDVYMHTINFLKYGSDVKDISINVRKSGVYILVLSNCGDLTDAKVSGSVLVRNAYGFLPGNEFHKMPFYKWLLLLYAVLALVWMGLSLRWWTELFRIQMCIAAVIFFGLLDALCWWIFYTSWNTTGVRNHFLFGFAILWSVIKSIFSYMLVLVAALGWGVTRPYLDKRIITRIKVVCFIYIVLGFARESVLSFRHSHSLSLAFVLLCLLPVALLNGGIFYWVFTALSSLIEILKERRQHEKLQLFQTLWNILIGTLAAATTALLAQIFDLSKSISSRWKHQWLFTDGISHTLFLVVLVAMMFLWAPNKNSQRYAYSSQVDDKPEDDDDDNDDVEVADSATLAVEQDLDDDADSDLETSNNVGGAVAPNTIGAGAVGIEAARDKDSGDGPL